MLKNKKELALKKLHKKIQADSQLPLKSNLVFGEGPSEAQIIFIGEAPGAKEDELMRPFVGRSGQLLDKMIESIALKRSDVYITNIVKRRPPENRDPLAEEILAYSPYLKEQIKIINPLIIVSLGRLALNYFLVEKKISLVQGQIFRLKNWDNKILIPMFHPAGALRTKQRLNDFKKSFQILAEVLEGKGKI